MDGLLSDGDISTLTMLLGLKTDEAMQGRINKLLDAHAAAKGVLAQVQAERELSQATAAEASRIHADAAHMKAGAEAKEADLAEKEKGIGQVIETLNAEKEAFGKIREQVETDIAARKAALELAEHQMIARIDKLEAREKDVEERADLLDQLHTTLAKHGKLKAAIEAYEAERDPEPAHAPAPTQS